MQNMLDSFSCALKYVRLHVTRYVLATVVLSQNTHELQICTQMNNKNRKALEQTNSQSLVTYPIYGGVNDSSMKPNSCKNTSMVYTCTYVYAFMDITQMCR